MSDSNLFGKINDRRVSLCRHEPDKEQRDYPVSFVFFDHYRYSRDSLIQILHNPDDEQPLSGRILAYYPFRYVLQEQKICVRRDQIRIAVFAQLNTFSDPFQHINLMVWILSTELGELMSMAAITHFHKNPRPLFTDADRKHAPLISRLMEHVVINRGGFVGWIKHESQLKLNEAISLSPSDRFEIEEDLCFDDDDLKYLRGGLEDEDGPHLQQFQDLHIKSVFNPRGVGSLSGYEDDNGPAIEEFVDDSLRRRLLEELDQMAA